jgi:glycosyltransferase involved in cell wall biosynthesis
LKTIKWRSKVALICRWSYRVSCGNEYLKEFAQQYNAKVVVIPTTIDTEGLHNRNKFKSASINSPEIIIGWTGSHSTIKYLTLIETTLQKIEIKYPFVSFLIIADKHPDLALKRLSFKTWNANTEIDDLLQVDIGIMPLPDDDWSKGKCGFKALQYLALEIPAVVSAVGVNGRIISQGVEGFLCHTEDEWQQALEQLINDATLRVEMGIRGRKKVVANYSVLSNSSAFFSLFI